MARRSSTVKHGPLAAAIVLLLALVAACGDDDGTGAASSSNGNGPVVAHPAEGDGSGATALIEGQLTMSSGCVLVSEFPVVWPYDTTWDAEDQAVQLADGQVVALGDCVSGGGGYFPMSSLAPEFAEPLADCPTDKWGEVAMFNAGEQITVTK